MDGSAALSLSGAFLFQNEIILTRVNVTPVMMRAALTMCHAV
jgi:hypothetical protein